MLGAGGSKQRGRASSVLALLVSPGSMREGGKTASMHQSVCSTTSPPKGGRSFVQY